MVSKLTSKGQTTIPVAIREKLKLREGDRIEYVIEGDRVTIRPEITLMSLRGCLKSDKGKGLTFAQIRERAAANARRKWK